MWLIYAGKILPVFWIEESVINDTFTGKLIEEQGPCSIHGKNESIRCCFCFSLRCIWSLDLDGDDGEDYDEEKKRWFGKTSKGIQIEVVGGGGLDLCLLRAKSGDDSVQRSIAQGSLARFWDWTDRKHKKSKTIRDTVKPPPYHDICCFVCWLTCEHLYLHFFFFCSFR